VRCRSPVPFPEKNGEIYIAISSRARRIIASIEGQEKVVLEVNMAQCIPHE